MKILLVDPPGRNKGLNTGLGYLSAALKKTHDIRILDLNNIAIGNCGDPNSDLAENELELRIKNAVKDFKPNIFGVSVKTFTAVIAKKIIDIVKNIDQNMITVVGGPHITLDGKKFITANKINFGIKGEGEYRFYELCRAIEKKSGWEKIDGLYFWEKNQLIFNEASSTIKELDHLDFPDYTKFSSVIENGNKIKEYPLLSSRGCPYNCEYCSMPMIMGRKWRSHSSQRVIEELKHAKKKYGSESFAVVDDNFTLNLERVESICNELINEKIRMPWNSQNGIRADRITKKIAVKMKHAGCKFVWIGIESADEYVFNNINKGEKLEDVKRGIKHLKNAGIRVGGFFITGLPYSTREADLKGIDFVKEQGIDGWWFNFVPYPYTKSFEWVQNNATILQSSDGVLQFGTNRIEPVFETNSYSKDDRIQTYQEIHVRLNYYDRLADVSLKPYARWKNVFEIVKPFGKITVFSFFLFLIKYNARLLLRKLKSQIIGVM